METTVASSVLCRLVLQLALLIAAVHGWCNLGLDSIPEEHAFSSLTITCDSSTPVVSWTSRYQEVCWGYTNCSNQTGSKCIGIVSSATNFPLPAVQGGTQCSYYLCVRDNYNDYRVNRTISCADNNPLPTTTITSSTSSQYLNTTAVTTQSPTPGLQSHQSVTSTQQTLDLSSSASVTSLVIAASETVLIANETTSQQTLVSMSTTLSSQPPTESQTGQPTTTTTAAAPDSVQTIIIVLSVLGVLFIALLIVLLCSTMLKRHRNWQHKIDFDNGVPNWEPFDTIITLSISIATLTEPLEKYETKIPIEMLVPENDEDTDVASSVSSASEILGEKVDCTRKHSNSEYIEVDGVQAQPLAWDNSGSCKCSTLLTGTSGGYLEYQGSIGQAETSDRNLEYQDSIGLVESSDEDSECQGSIELVEPCQKYQDSIELVEPCQKYQDSIGLVETSNGYLKYQESREASDNCQNSEDHHHHHHSLVETSDRYVLYQDSNEQSDKCVQHIDSHETSAGYIQYQDSKETSYGHTQYQGLVETSDGYVQYQDSYEQSDRCVQHNDSHENSGAFIQYQDSKESSCGPQEIVGTNDGYIQYQDNKESSCAHTQYQGLVETSDGYVRYQDNKDSSCGHTQYQVETSAGYIQYQDSNGYLHTNPI